MLAWSPWWRILHDGKSLKKLARVLPGRAFVRGCPPLSAFGRPCDDVKSRPGNIRNRIEGTRLLDMTVFMIQNQFPRFELDGVSL